MIGRLGPIISGLVCAVLVILDSLWSTAKNCKLRLANPPATCNSQGEHTSSVKHKPTPASTIGRPRRVVIGLVEKQPGTHGLPTRDVAVKDTFPAVNDVPGFPLEPGVPFFGAVFGSAEVRGGRREG